MVVTSEVLGAWRTGLAGYRPECLIKQVGFSLDLKDVSESAAVTMFGRELQVVGALQRKARPENAVLWNGTDISGTVEERKVRPQTRAVMRRLR